MIRFNASALLSAATLALAAAPAFAGSTESLPTQHVSFADLDLATPAGQAMLKHRVHRAVDAVCGEYDVHEISRNGPVIACRRVATTAADVKVAAAISRATQQAAIQSPDLMIAAR